MAQLVAPHWQCGVRGSSPLSSTRENIETLRAFWSPFDDSFTTTWDPTLRVVVVGPIFIVRACDECSILAGAVEKRSRVCRKRESKLSEI